MCTSWTWYPRLKRFWREGSQMTIHPVGVINLKK
jgi:hypothetical protein